MSFDASHAFKYAEDFMLAFTSIIGRSPYHSYLITITNDQVDINDVNTGRVVTQQRLLIADGYRDYAAGDGYLNPIIKQINGEQLVLSNGQLTANQIMLGPIVFPYNWNNFAGGTDSALFQPPLGSNSNTQIYVQLRGPGLSPNGNFFEVKQVVLKNMAAFSYRLLLEATSSNPALT
jgi:hypothetical protein